MIQIVVIITVGPGRRSRKVNIRRVPAAVVAAVGVVRGPESAARHIRQ